MLRCSILPHCSTRSARSRFVPRGASRRKSECFQALRGRLLPPPKVLLSLDLFKESCIYVNFNGDPVACDSFARDANCDRQAISFADRRDLFDGDPKRLGGFGGGKKANGLFGFACDVTGERDRGHGEDPFLFAYT
jgi:hypothetical protein